MRLHKLIERKSAEKAVLEDQVRRTTASMNPAASFGSSGQDKVGEAVVEIVYLDNEIARYKAERSALRKEIGAIVERLGTPTHRSYLDAVSRIQGLDCYWGGNGVYS